MDVSQPKTADNSYFELCNNGERIFAWKKLRLLHQEYFISVTGIKKPENINTVCRQVGSI